MDWSNCIICGKSDGYLLNPSVKPNCFEIYNNFLKIVQGFSDMKKMPTSIAISNQQSVDDLITHSAKWHKSCRLKFSESKLLRTKERFKNMIEDECPSERKSRRLSSTVTEQQRNCIFCKGSVGTLHSCSTFNMDANLRNMATKMHDLSLLSSISGGDLVAIEAMYHSKCMLKYKNRFRAFERQSENVSSSCTDSTEAMVFAELIDYIETGVKEGNFIYKLSELHLLFEEKLRVVGSGKNINKGRLKNKILETFTPSCQEQSDGKNILLVFSEGLKSLLKETVNSNDLKTEAVAITRTCNSIRAEMFDKELFTFSGAFPEDCEETSVPESLKSLVSLLLYGPNIKDKNLKNSRSCLSICQLILFNSKESYARKNLCEFQRHFKSKEPPLPLYLAFKIHTLTRSKKLITQMHDLGLSVSYARFSEIQEEMTFALCRRFHEEKVVCPTQLRKGIFSVGALDNIDHNPSAATAQGSFHGTSISIFQFPTKTNKGLIREPTKIANENEAQVQFKTLPDSYKIVPAVNYNLDLATVPPSVTKDVTGDLEVAKQQENEWLSHSALLLKQETIDRDAKLAWAAYHACRQAEENKVPGISCLLPLFHEKAATVAMVKHGMTIIRDTTQFCNPGQIPVMAVDQPLFALAKQVQWKWPETLGEKKFVVMLGGLHIEMSLWRMIGELLAESGWTNVLAEAEIASSGTCDSFLHASHVTKTRHAHQVTAVALNELRREAFEASKNESFSSWKSEMIQKSPVFKFWDLILDIELLVLIFVRSHRENNFNLYIDAMTALVPLLFALDHTNYARWMSVHIRDMKSLSDEVLREFNQCWVFQKTNTRFSSIPIDQAHEQNNKMIKNVGGVVGLTEKPNALKKWMISGPEQARLLNEFEQSSPDNSVDAAASHEEGVATQKTFHLQVTKLFETIKALGNPFMELSPELMTVDTHDYADDHVKQTLEVIAIKGKEQYNKFIKDVFIERSIPIHATIKKNNFPLFKTPIGKVKAKIKEQTVDLKSDYSLFGRLFIACQVREGDLEEFFAHENHSWPPALSHRGKLRLPSSKSDLLACLGSPSSEDPPVCASKVFDGAVVIHSLGKGDATTFKDYADNVFMPWVFKQLEIHNRIDIVWDSYKPDSLKETAREKRGLGYRRKVSSQTKLPANFIGFLRDPRNKAELFEFLSECVESFPDYADKQVFITKGENVVNKGTAEPINDSDHEEADTRMCLHVLDAINHGFESIMVSTVDTDVVVILLGIFSKLLNHSPKIKVWVEFGKGKHLRYYYLNSLFENLGPRISNSLPFFHAITGCDTTSQFSGKGKKAGWKSWSAFPDVTDAFCIEHPFVPLEKGSVSFSLIEKFVCVLYDHTVNHGQVNLLRRELFTQGKCVKMMQSLPPTQDALHMHVNRSLYQASVWVSCLQPEQNLPSPQLFGWKNIENTWKPNWTNLPEAAKSCRELIKCGCKAEPLCTKKCACKNHQLPCTSLCHCNGNCNP